MHASCLRAEKSQHAAQICPELHCSWQSITHCTPVSAGGIIFICCRWEAVHMSRFMYKPTCPAKTYLPSQGLIFLGDRRLRPLPA